MGFTLTRKSFRIGASTAVTLPADWCRYYGERINSLTMFGDEVLILAPAGLEDQAKRLLQGINGKEVVIDKDIEADEVTAPNTK